MAARCRFATINLFFITDEAGGICFRPFFMLSGPVKASRATFLSKSRLGISVHLRLKIKYLDEYAHSFTRFIPFYRFCDEFL